jgi:hypothetical protein
MEHITNLGVEKESVVVVHDPSTGEIAHVHYVITAKGGKHPDQATLEKDALEQFSRLKPRLTKKMALFHAEPAQFKPGTRYKVDTTKRALVEAPKPVAPPKTKP